MYHFRQYFQLFVQRFLYILEQLAVVVSSFEQISYKCFSDSYTVLFLNKSVFKLIWINVSINHS